MYYWKDRIKSGSMLAWFIWLLSSKNNNMFRLFLKLPIAVDAYGVQWYYAMI